MNKQTEINPKNLSTKTRKVLEDFIKVQAGQRPIYGFGVTKEEKYQELKWRNIDVSRSLSWILSFIFLLYGLIAWHIHILIALAVSIILFLVISFCSSSIGDILIKLYYRHMKS